MEAPKSYRHPEAPRDLPNGWAQKFPELHPAMVQATRMRLALKHEWFQTTHTLAALQEKIRLRQAQIGKDEIRSDPELVQLRRECIQLHNQRIRINMDLVRFDRDYDKAQDPRVVTDVIPKEAA